MVEVDQMLKLVGQQRSIAHTWLPETDEDQVRLVAIAASGNGEDRRGVDEATKSGRVDERCEEKMRFAVPVDI